MTDGVDGLQENDRTALAELYRRYANWLRTRIASRFGAQFAEDLMQETWIRIAPYQARGTIKHPKALLFKIACNLAIDAARDPWRRTQALIDGGDGEAVPEAGSQVEALVLKQTILSLPEPLRDVFVLSRFGGLTYEQIGGRLGISARTVEERMARARAHCAARLGL